VALGPLSFALTMLLYAGSMRRLVSPGTGTDEH
jgi:hypothetical protein